MKTNGFISKVTKLTVALSLAASVLPAGIMTASAAKTETVDWCLDDSGEIRDGVKITAHYTKTDGTEVVFNAGDNGKADGDGNGSNDPLSWVLTSAESYYAGEEGTPGFWIGWKGGGVKDSYYIQVDLGEERNINEIGFAPYGSDDYWWRTDRIYLSNDADFAESFQVTDGNILFENKKLTTYTYTTAETKSYRYIRICTNPGDVICGAAKLVVKGINEIPADDLLHDADGSLTATLTASHPGYDGESGKLADINNIADGKYELDYSAGALDSDKATSFVSDFTSADEKWVQADLGEVKAIESVRVLLYPGTENSDDYFRCDVKIIASNTPDFSTYTTLAESTDAQLERGVWLEYKDEDYSGKYRYIRVVKTSNSVIGVTELEVNGYDLCESYLLYTNIDKYLITETNTSPQAVSNVSNANKNWITPWDNTTRDAVVNNRLQLAFSGNVDASTVNTSTLTVKNTYTMGNGDTSSTSSVSYTPVVDGNIIYIDLCNFNPNATVEMNITDGITVDGIAVTPQTLKFKTGFIAPVPYVEGKVIKNVAQAKTVMFSTDSKTDTTKIKNEEWGNNFLTNNLINATYNNQYAVIDLGNEYDIVAYEICSNYSWHIDCYNVYMSDSWATLMDSANQVYDKTTENYSSKRDANKKLAESKKTRYVTLYCPSFNGQGIFEFLAYAYVPATAENGVSDAYYDYDGKNFVFKVEKDTGVTSKIVIARYTQEDRLVDVNITDNSSATVTSSGTDADGNAVEYKVKAFVWKDMEKLEPLTPAVVY